MSEFIPLSVPNFCGNERKYVDEALEGFDWCSLKLVFEPWENDWYLVGLVHGEWTT